MSQSLLDWRRDHDGWSARQDDVNYRIDAPPGTGSVLTVRDQSGRDLDAERTFQNGDLDLTNAAMQAAEVFAFMTRYGYHPDDRRGVKRPIWGGRGVRTSWLRHFVHAPDAEAMLLHMDFTAFRPRPVCGASLPLAADPWIFVFSREHALAALNSGDRVCKRCLAHLGLYQMRANQSPPECCP